MLAVRLRVAKLLKSFCFDHVLFGRTLQNMTVHLISRCLLMKALNTVFGGTLGQESQSCPVDGNDQSL